MTIQQRLNPTELKKALGNIPEREIKKEIINYLHSQGHFIIPIRTVGIWHPIKKVYIKAVQKGVADIIGIKRTDNNIGQFYALEVKRPGGKIRPEQRIFIQQVQEYGGIAGFVYSVKDVRRLGL